MTTIESWRDELNKNEAVLDKIDFLPFLEKYDEVGELKQAVEDIYDDTDICNNDFLDGCIFCYMDRYDLAQYLMKRYPGYDMREPEYYEPPIYIWKKRS